MNSAGKSILGVMPLIGMFLGILHNFFYWGTFGVNYFSFVGFQEIFVSSIQPIVYTFLAFFVVTVVYYFIIRFFAGEDVFSKLMFLDLPSIKTRLQVLIVLFVLGVLSALYGHMKGWMYFYLYVSMFSALMMTSLLVRAMKFYKLVDRDFNSYEVCLIGLLLLITVYICFVGHRSAHFIKNGSVGVYFEESKGYGRYSGVVGDYFVFYQESGSLFFLPKNDVGSFTLVEE